VSDSFSMPKGYGFRRLTHLELQHRDDLLGTLQIFERPRSRGERRYILGVDVADGIGQDRSAVAVHRMGTLEDPEEQVALYVGDQVTPVQLAYIVDAIGRLYADADHFEAMAVVECNNHGLSTQDTLQLHLGYAHFYRWEYLDAADPQRRYSTKVGWVTTPRTRPMLLDKLYAALTTIDPVTHNTDLLVHAAILRDELADFQTEGALWEAAAARGAHDDVVMATAIAHYIAWRLQGGEQEPLSERRSRMHAERAARAAAHSPAGVIAARRDWRNTGCTADEWHAQVDPDEVQDNLYDSERGAPIFLP
jgi:hypothetical protein